MKGRQQAAPAGLRLARVVFYTEMAQVHSIRTVFDRCKHKSQKEEKHIYTVASLGQSNILERLSTVTVA